MATDQDSLALSETILAMQQKIKKLEEGNRANRLPNSSVDINTGRGYIPFMDGKVEKGRIGRMPDGTINVSSTNNPEAPHIPLPPICEALIGGVNVTCTGLQGTPPGDFSHVNVYCDDVNVGTFLKLPDSLPITPLSNEQHLFQLTSVNLSGTESDRSDGVICTPNQVVSSDVADGIITSLKLADEAVTNAKIAAEAVTGTKIAAETIEGSMIAAETIYGENIAAETITGNNILANAITAIQIAANAVTAGKIEAGAVTADKLEAILLLANRIIAGDPIASRVEIYNQGIEQRGPDNQLLIQIGATPGDGQANVITIIDPTDNTNMLATLGEDGVLSCSGLNVFGEVNINGTTFDQIIYNLPWGLQCFGKLDDDSNATTTRIGVYELSFQAQAGRTYRFASSSFYIKGAGGGFPGGVLEVRYTTDGSRPTMDSPLLADATTNDEVFQSSTPAGGTTSGGTNGHTSVDLAAPYAHSHNYGADHTHGAPLHSHQTQFAQISTKLECLYDFDTDCLVRLVYVLKSSYGGNIVLDDPDGDAGIQFYVEDIGPEVNSTGGATSSSGTGTATSGTGTKVSSFSSTYSRFWQQNYNSNPGINDYAVQGRDGQGIDRVTLYGFDHAAIRTALASADISKVELFLYSNNWVQSTGGIAVIGTHNVDTAPTAYSYVSRGVKLQQLNRPEGKWIELPLSVATDLQAGNIKGIVLDHRGQADVGNQVYTGNFDPYNSVANRPVLRFTYEK